MSRAAASTAVVLALLTGLVLGQLGSLPATLLVMHIDLIPGFGSGSPA
jgi:hypothetical protein